jgi:hypothetical protein
MSCYSDALERQYVHTSAPAPIDADTANGTPWYS